MNARVLVVAVVVIAFGAGGLVLGAVEHSTPVVALGGASVLGGGIAAEWWATRWRE